MNNDNEFILWIDVEATDRDPERGSMLEIAAIPTLMDGTIISPGIERLVKISDLGKIMGSTEEKILRLHEKSGLWNDLWNSNNSVSIKEIENDLIDLVRTFNSKNGNIYFGGNSVTLDRKFVSSNLPNFANILSHRSIDCTSIALMLQRNSKIRPFKKKMNHRAYSDAEESYEEYRYYLSRFSQFFETIDSNGF